MSKAKNDNFLGGKDNVKWTGIGELGGSKWSSWKASAIERNLEWSISKEFVWELYLKQNRRCMLSNLAISFRNDFDLRRSTHKRCTASLDRINSKKGYVEDNVQLVHRDINRLKGALEENYFIQLCKNIAMNKEVTLPKIVAIDFDGTVSEDIGYPKIGAPKPGALECMKKLHESGTYIIIWTCRSGKEVKRVKKYLEEHQFPFDLINENHPIHVAQYKEDSKKIFANVYCDDRNVGGFPGWEFVEKWLLKEGYINSSFSFPLPKEKPIFSNLNPEEPKR